jgi:hypothetical protein
MAVQLGCGVEDRGVCQRAARSFEVWLGGTGAGGQRGTRVNTSHDRVLLLPIRKYTCYCPPQKRKVTATKSNCWLTPRRVAAVPLNSVINLSKNYATAGRECNPLPVDKPQLPSRLRR